MLGLSQSGWTEALSILLSGEAEPSPQAEADTEEALQTSEKI